MDESLVRLTEAEARKAGKSLPDFILEIVARSIGSEPPPEKAKPASQQEALRRILAGPMWDVTEDGRMPTSDERNARR